VRAYVAGGGRVLATGETSLADERGAGRSEFALADVLGVSLRGAVKGHFAIDRPEEPEPASGRFEQVDAKGSVVYRRLEVDPAGSVAGCEDPLPVGDPTWPVFAVSEFGSGRAGYVAFDVGRRYTEHGDMHISELMADVVDSLLPHRQIRVIAPRSVEVTVWEQVSPRRTIIHLANLSVQWSMPTSARQVFEIVPAHGIEILLPRPYDKTAVSARHTEAAVTERDGELAITLSGVEDYAAVVLTPAGGG
jgi:hypothetical protein